MPPPAPFPRQPQVPSARHLDRLVASVYDELKRIARRRMRDERQGHTLQTTALVHEAYLRLRELRRVEWRNQRHFFLAAAGIMRRLLIDRARAAKAEKRGGGAARVTLDEHPGAADDGVDLIALDAALKRMSERDKTLARVVELRYFAGLSIAETARTMALSPASVKRKWALAQASLYRELRGTQR